MEEPNYSRLPVDRRPFEPIVVRQKLCHLERLYDASTQGDWYWEKRFKSSTQEYKYMAATHGEFLRDVIEVGDRTKGVSIIVDEHDANFIATAHNVMPLVFEELRRLWDIERRLKAAIEAKKANNLC